MSCFLTSDQKISTEEDMYQYSKDFILQQGATGAFQMLYIE